MIDEPQIPRRTAEDVEIAPDGVPTKLWMRTLNALDKDDVQREADWHALLTTRRLRKGAEYHGVALAKFEDRPIEDLARFICDEHKRNGKYLDEALKLFPILPQPERGDQSETAFMTEVEKWEKKRVKYDRGRDEKEEQLYAQDVALHSTKPRNDLVDQCVEIFISHEYMKTYTTRHTAETLLRACRRASDHSEQYFKDIAQIRLLDDADLLYLVRKYNELDSIRPRDIPT